MNSELIEIISSAMIDEMEKEGVENFTANSLTDTKSGRGVEFICKFNDGKSVAEIMQDLRNENQKLKDENEKLKDQIDDLI